MKHYAIVALETAARRRSDGSAALHDPFERARRELMGRRWTFDEAALLIELVRQGTAHLPMPITDGERRAERAIYGRYG